MYIGPVLRLFPPFFLDLCGHSRIPEHQAANLPSAENEGGSQGGVVIARIRSPDVVGAAAEILRRGGASALSTS
jgi:hypothetical protein